MTTRHLLRVDDEAAVFGPLIETVRAHDLRIGWLDLTPVTPPVPLATAAELGVLRAVAVGGGRSVAVKPMAGPPVLRDLLREHFRGCALVLIRGISDEPGFAEIPQLELAGGLTVLREDGSRLSLEPATLAARLRRPRPWS